jgi:hypothetical protein
MRGSLHYAVHDEAVNGFGRDDGLLGYDARGTDDVRGTDDAGAALNVIDKAPDGRAEADFLRE